MYIDPYSVPDDTVRAQLCLDLSETLGINGDSLMKKLQMTKYRYLVIAKQVEYDRKEKVVEIKKKKYEYVKDGKKQYAYGSSMVGIDPDVKRYYPNGNLASHIIGYTNSEGNGQAGASSTITIFFRAYPAERSRQRMPTAERCRSNMRLFTMRQTVKSSS